MSTHMRVSARLLALVLAIPITVSPVLWAGRASNDSAEITALLADAKSEAAQLIKDTADMESFTRSNISWQSYAIAINRVKDHVNELGGLSGKLNNARSGGSPWQQDAIDRINPLLKELATNVEATINQLSKHQSLVHSSHYKTYVQATHKQATNVASLISDYVEYGKNKDKMEALAKEE
jgi:hypothetical protein